MHIRAYIWMWVPRNTHFLVVFPEGVGKGVRAQTACILVWLPWKYTRVHDSIWQYMGVHGSTWILDSRFFRKGEGSVHESTEQSMRVQDSPWEYRTVHESTGQSMTVRRVDESTWEYIGGHACTCGLRLCRFTRRKPCLLQSALCTRIGAPLNLPDKERFLYKMNSSIRSRIIENLVISR
jgi:hypothetical protein